MKTYKYLYPRIYCFQNLLYAYKKARKRKTKKFYVKIFGKELLVNLLQLQKELKEQTYKPKPLKTFILRDPKTRKISKSEFRDRVVHHALIRVLEPIFDKVFIYDSCANRIKKGTSFALNRLDVFKRKVTKNNVKTAFCLKADIKHYFQEVNHSILLNLISKKIKEEKVVWLINLTINNTKRDVGMPLGNLTSQFFANIYLNELDYFIKHNLKAKYYLRYVDDFVILHQSKQQLKIWKEKISRFLKEELKLELHPEKSKVIPLSKGIDFVGFRNFYYHKLLRKRNIRKMRNRIEFYKRGVLTREQLLSSFEGWRAYAIWANSYNLRKKIVKEFNSV